MGIPITISSQTNLPDVTPKTPNKGMPIVYNPEIDKKSLDRVSRIDPFDTINFTNIYTDDLSKYKKYDVPTTRHFNWDDERAKNQGTGEKWLNGISKALVTTVGAVAENTLGVLAGLGELTFGSGYYYDNFIGQSVDKANDWMRESMPNYRTQAEIDMTTGQKLGTANFWADTVANGVGYSLGSIATMFLSGGTGIIMRGAGAISKASKSKKIYDVSKAITKGTKLADKTFKSSKGQALLNSANTLEMGLYMSLAEASVEAREAQKQAYEGLVNLELEKRGLEKEFELGNKVLEDILNASYSAGNADFLMQLPVLAGTNLLMFGKQITGFRTASKVNKDVALDAATKSVIDKTAGRGLFRTGLSRLKPTAQGSLTEAFQEGWQFASKVAAVDYHTDKYFNGGAADMSQAMLDGLNETFGTQEGLESMLVGAIVGGGVSGVTSAVQKPYAQRKKNAKYLADLLNGGYLRNAANKGKTSNMMTAALVQMEKAKQEGNIKAFKDAQNKLIMYNAFEAMENGGFDVFMEKLNDAAAFEEVEFAKAFGYDTEKSIQEQTGKTKEQIIEGAKKKYQSFKETYDSINEAFPSENRKTGLPRMRMSEEEIKAEETVYQRKEGLRAQLILGMHSINDRNRRLKSIHTKMQGVLDGSVNLNNGSVMKDILALPGFGGLDANEYSAKEESTKTQKRLNEIISLLIKNNVDPIKVAEFTEEAQDYLALLAENQVTVEAHIKLSSDQYTQNLFEEERIKREAEAKQAAKDSKNEKAIRDAKTEKDIKKNVEDAKDEVKVDSEIKRKELKEQEQQEKKKYLDYYEGLPAETQILNLKAIDQTDLTDSELEGLKKAIKELEYEVNNKDGFIKEEPVQDLDNMEIEDQEVIKEPQPKKRVIITDPNQLTIDDEVNEVTSTEEAVLKSELAVNPTLWVTDKKKVGVDDSGKPNLEVSDVVTINDVVTPIQINQNVLLTDVKGKVVSFEIIETDYFKENDKGKPEEYGLIPIYIKLDGQYIGKLQSGKTAERKAIVEKLQAGEAVTTRISEVIANNYNNTVLSEASDTSYFYDIKEEIGGGSTRNVLLAFTAGIPGATEVVQWEISEVSENKNQENLPKITREVQRVQNEGRIDQIAVVARPENVPGGQARILLTSTADLSEASKRKVLELIQNKQYEKAAEIIATSSQPKNANNNSMYLSFSSFQDGQQYFVYYSPSLEKLVRINETEMSKVFNNEQASFNVVNVDSDGKYVNLGKRNTVKDKFDLLNDFSSFIENKKYHIDKGLANTTDEYFSPTTGSRYDTYQDYLFSESEVGDRVEGEGHYSILSVDTLQINESLFNNPRVIFERGEILGKTAEEVIKDSKLNKTNQSSLDIQSEIVAPQEFKDRFNKKNCK
tara:strand:- start:6660 stop:10793 length:4134 start_codon:yes stop_codon:yes gene_type:complete